MSEKKEWFIIINPEAKSGKAKIIWPKIKETLDSKEINYKFVFTRYALEAIDIIENAVKEGWVNFIAVGGDGTINEVINGVFLQEFVECNKITFGMIPLGTGNDWGRGLGITSNYKNAIDTILKEKIVLHDAGIVEYNALNMTKKRFLINVAGFGFDASVVEKVNQIRENKNNSKISYFKTIFQQIFKYNTTKSEILVDGKIVFEGMLFSCCVGLGKYNGGGLMQVPHASFNSGILAVTVIAKITPIKFILSFPKLLIGKILSIKEAYNFKGENIIINSKTPIGVEIDGEYLGVTKAKISILKNAINIITNI